MPDKLLTLRQVAERLQSSLISVRRSIHAERLPTYRVLGVKVSEVDLAVWLGTAERTEGYEMTDCLLTVAEVAERLNCSTVSVRRLIRTEGLPTHRVAGVKVSEKDLAAWLATRRQVRSNHRHTYTIPVPRLR